MVFEAETLPDDPQLLKQRVLSMQALLEEKEQALKEQQATVRHQHTEIICLQEKLRLLIHKRFGVSCEAHADQLRLFDEAEQDAVEGPVADSGTIDGPAHRRAKRGRRALPKDLPRVEIVHDIGDAQKGCPHDGTPLDCIGEAVSEQLDIVPATVQVLKHIRKKYACPCCERHVVTAELPKQPIPKSLASPGTLAFVATSKYCDALPLYRQQVIFERLGHELPRATLANWMVQCGKRVQPLINLLEDRLLSQGVIEMDETPVQVLNEAGQRAQSDSYLWVRGAGPPEARIILFDYDPGRSQTVPPRLLPDYRGALMVDGYGGYDRVCQHQGLTRLGCWAHARRQFVEAQRASGKKPSPQADHALKLIGKLYKVEKACKELDPDERRRQRREKAQPILDKLHRWLQKTLPGVPPKTALGKALHYLHSQWSRLIGYLDDGAYPIDNNRIENAIRPFAIGRKNWLFSNSTAGIKASANLYSLVETAKANGVEPYQYLKHLFTELPNADTVEEIEQLLPWAFKQCQPCS